jgi:hypothetical protein
VTSFAALLELAPLCPGDADGSFGVDKQDLVAVLAHWLTVYAPQGTGPGDANADGVVDFGDVTAVLGNWGGGCAP